MITLTIPNDDTIALRQFGKALIEIASAKEGHPVDVTVTPLVISTETLQQSAPQMMGEPEVDTTAQQVESLTVPGATHIITEQKLVGEPVPVGDGNFSQGYVATVEEIADPVDSTGTPWDERIHSASKALNGDGTWRLRRKPKDMDESEWATFVETVKTELTWKKCDPEVLEQMTDVGMDNSGETSIILGKDGDISINTGVASVSFDPAHDKPPVTPPGDDFHTDADVVTEQTVAGIPPLPVPPPVTTATLEMQVPPPPHVVPVTVDVQWDFPRLMTFLTERHGKIDVATVNTLLAQDGMLSVQELNAHPDKIGPFVARVKAHLGE